MLCVSPFVFSACASSSSPLFDGAYIVYSGNGEFDYNGSKSSFQASGRLQAVKSGGSYDLVFSGSVSGLPPPAPLSLTSASVTFKTSEGNRIITLVEKGIRLYSPFWIDPSVRVGDKVQMGLADAPYSLDVQSFESFEAVGKQVRSIVLAVSVLNTQPQFLETMSGKVYFDAYTGVLLGGSIAYEWRSLKPDWSFYIKFSGQASATETNMPIGGEAWPWYYWLAIGAVIAVIAVAAFIIHRRKKPRASHPAEISPPPESIPPPSPPPSTIEKPTVGGPSQTSQPSPLMPPSAEPTEETSPSPVAPSARMEEIFAEVQKEIAELKKQVCELSSKSLTSAVAEGKPTELPAATMHPPRVVSVERREPSAAPQVAEAPEKPPPRVTKIERKPSRPSFLSRLMHRKPKVTTPPPSPTPTAKCSKCGAQLKPDWKHCGECGAPIEKSSA